MEKQPFFTIGIPVYNTEKWIGECIESVLSQSFADFEILIVDDSSRDKSIDIVKQYQQNDSRIVIVHKENGGLPAARNTMIHFAKGQYIFFLDSDDILCENILENSYNTIVNSHYPDILHTNYIISSHGNITEKKFLYPGDEYFTPDLSKQERFLKLWLDNKFAATASSKFIKLAFLHNYGLAFSTRYTSAEDRDFTMHLMCKFDTIAYGNYNSFCYFHPREGSMTTNIGYKSLSGIIWQWTDFYKDVSLWTMPEEYRKKVAEDKAKFASSYRDFILGLFNKTRSKEEIFKCIELIDSHLGKDIKKLPDLQGRDGIITKAFRLMGIKPVCRMLYTFFKLKGLVN